MLNKEREHYSREIDHLKSQLQRNHKALTSLTGLGEQKKVATQTVHLMTISQSNVPIVVSQSENSWFLVQWQVNYEMSPNLTFYRLTKHNVQSLNKQLLSDVCKIWTVTMAVIFCDCLWRMMVYFHFKMFQTNKKT